MIVRDAVGSSEGRTFRMWGLEKREAIREWGHKKTEPVEGGTSEW